jgi:PhnB protein
VTTVLTVPEGYQAVTPWVVVQGVPAFIEFLTDVFDAEETIRMLADDGVRVSHAEVRINGAPVMMFDSADGWPPTPAYLRVYVADCAEVLRRAASAGSRIVTEPTEMFFGERVGRFSGDPWGNLWWVHSRLAELSPDEAAARATNPEAVEAMRYVAETLDAEMQERGRVRGGSE